MFMHTGCPAVAITLEDGTFNPDVTASATLSTDLKTLIISVPSADPKLKTATWTVPMVGGTSTVPIRFDTSPAPPVESALALNLAFGPDTALGPRERSARKKAPAKKATSKVAKKKRK